MRSPNAVWLSLPASVVALAAQSPSLNAWVLVNPITTVEQRAEVLRELGLGYAAPVAITDCRVHWGQTRTTGDRCTWETEEIAVFCQMHLPTTFEASGLTRYRPDWQEEITEHERLHIAVYEWVYGSAKDHFTPMSCEDGVEYRRHYRELNERFNAELDACGLDCDTRDFLTRLEREAQAPPR